MKQILKVLQYNAKDKPYIFFCLDFTFNCVLAEITNTTYCIQFYLILDIVNTHI